MFLIGIYVILKLVNTKKLFIFHFTSAFRNNITFFFNINKNVGYVVVVSFLVLSLLFLIFFIILLLLLLYGDSHNR